MANTTAVQDPSRYQVRVLASGALAVVDTEARNRVALVGTDEAVAEFLADYEDSRYDQFIKDEDGSVTFARYLEDRAARGTWFGAEDRF